MASVKIASLLIKTIAKPIATQLKAQAQSHESFKKICIALAQRMHRTETALRTNLIRDNSAAMAKVRPLNEKRAIDNGATAISEGFLFCIAAGLIIGESYRGSRSNKKQRDRTEDAVDELREAVELLASNVGVERERLWRSADALAHISSERQGDEGKAAAAAAKGEQSSTGEHSESAFVPEGPAPVRAQLEALEKDRLRLQHAVTVLLRLALRSGWVQGEEALQLGQILEGGDVAAVSGSKSAEQPTAAAASAAPPAPPSREAKAETRSSVLSEVAKARAAAIAREVRFGDGGNGQVQGPTLAELLERTGTSMAGSTA